MSLVAIQVLVGVLLLSSCGGYEYKQKKISSAPPSYFAIREKIIKPQCISCHPAFESHYELMGMVKPGDAEGSKLYSVINSDEMPPTGRKVPDETKEQLKEWIDQGARL